MNRPMWDRIRGFAMMALTSSVLTSADRGPAAAGAAPEPAAAPLREVADFQAVAALDDILYPVGAAAYRISLMKETQPDAALRDAATAQYQALQEWSVGVTYREDVFKAVKAFADPYETGQRPKLAGEDLKLYRDAMRDFRRAGLTLDKATRDKVEALQKQLARLSTEFDRHLGEARQAVVFTAEELEGVPAAFLSSVKTEDGRYSVLANVTPHYLAVAHTAKREATRQRLELARFALAQKENGPLLDEIVAVRDQVAALLGYA